MPKPIQPHPSQHTATSATQTQVQHPRKPFILPFFASISAQGLLQLSEEGVTLTLGDQVVELLLSADKRQALEATPPTTDQLFQIEIWPRTADGRVSTLELGKYKPITSPAKSGLPFSGAGRLLRVDAEEGYFEVSIEPNAKGPARSAFTLQVWASLDALKTLPRKSKTFRLEGEYRPQSQRLIMKQAKICLVGKMPKAAPAAATGS